jgi:hypothetical protein
MAQPPCLEKAGNVHLNDFLCKATALENRFDPAELFKPERTIYIREA